LLYNKTPRITVATVVGVRAEVVGFSHSDILTMLFAITSM